MQSGGFSRVAPLPFRRRSAVANQFDADEVQVVAVSMAGPGHVPYATHGDNVALQMGIDASLREENRIPDQDPAEAEERDEVRPLASEAAAGPQHPGDALHLSLIHI